VKYELASREWFAAMHALVSDRVSAALRLNPDLRTSACEVFLKPPPHLAPDGADRLAWSYSVANGRLTFALEERDDVDLKIVGDYDAILPIARLRVGGDPQRQAELQAMSAELVQAGRLAFPRRAAPPEGLDPHPFDTIHDAIARLTA
jgi:hypothetical protein